MDKAIGAKCGHVKRRIFRDEPLTGKVLEFALSAIEGGDRPGEHFYSDMADKMRAGQPLSEYEKHVMVDMVLLHIRLAS